MTCSPRNAIGAPLSGPYRNPDNGHLYFLLGGCDWTPEGFAASEAAATTLGGHLVTINDAVENNWVSSTFANVLAPGTPGILGIGLNDLAVEGTYVWTSGEPATYFNWDPYAYPGLGPQPDGELDDLVGITLSYLTPGRWHDFYATGPLVPPSYVYPVVETVVPEISRPISGPIRNPDNGHLYYLLEGCFWTPEGFAASEAGAVALGGHLVAINDAAENDWVVSTFMDMLNAGSPGLIGIGLNDLAVEGSYVWTNGEPATYFNWDPYAHPGLGPQPDGELDDLVGITLSYLTPGTWHDFYATGSLVPPSYVYSVAEVVVPEIDPAGMGSVLAIVTGALGLLERRRLKVA